MEKRIEIQRLQKKYDPLFISRKKGINNLGQFKPSPGWNRSLKYFLQIDFKLKLEKGNNWNEQGRTKCYHSVMRGISALEIYYIIWGSGEKQYNFGQIQRFEMAKISGRTIIHIQIYN